MKYQLSYQLNDYWLWLNGWLAPIVPKPPETLISAGILWLSLRFPFVSSTVAAYNQKAWNLWPQCVGSPSFTGKKSNVTEKENSKKGSDRSLVHFQSSSPCSCSRCACFCRESTAEPRDPVILSQLYNWLFKVAINELSEASANCHNTLTNWRPIKGRHL